MPHYLFNYFEQRLSTRMKETRSGKAQPVSLSSEKNPLYLEKSRAPGHHSSAMRRTHLHKKAPARLPLRSCPGKQEDISIIETKGELIVLSVLYLYNTNIDVPIVLRGVLSTGEDTDFFHLLFNQ